MRFLAFDRTGRRQRGLAASLGAVVLLALAALPWRSGGEAAPSGVASAQDAGYALRFYGSGIAAPGRDRVVIPLDAPPRPVDIGATDFTMEFWLKATPGENNGAATCGANAGWITANTILDRDTFGDGDYGDFGVALSQGVIAVGASVGATGTTVCSSLPVADGEWHHVAAVRRLNGAVQLFVDGQPAGAGQGTAGDASYRDGRSTTNPADPYLVLGAEKHDAGATYPSFSGWLDEVRLSTTVRYTAAFTPPAAPFITDRFTAALYHFDEGPAGACSGAVRDEAGAGGGPSDGACVHGGSPAGPNYVADTPFVTLPPTSTRTPTATPTATSTWTATPVSSTATGTATATVTATASATPQPSATNTGTVTPIPPTIPPTATNTATSTATHPATHTPQPGAGTATPYAGNSPTATHTPDNTVLFTETVTPPIVTPSTATPPTVTPPLCPTAAFTPILQAGLAVARALEAQSQASFVYFPLIVQESPCVSITP
jgi:hypothetical protein